MKKILIATTIALSLTSNIASAKNGTSADTENNKITDEQKTEIIGFGSGMVSGAIVGGPLGAIVGGVIGVLIAEDVNDNEIIKASKQDLKKVSGQLSVERYQNKRLKSQLLALEKQQMTHLASLNNQTDQEFFDHIKNVETHLMFKTASFEIEELYKPQLDNLAIILREYPQLKINITGYADTRGDKQYNQSLSEQRAKTVKEYLLNKQVNPKQIDSLGAGELVRSSHIQNPNNSTLNLNNSTQKPQPNTRLEDLFFSRKVNIRFMNNTSQMTAAK